jgi:hypothetical protein
LILLSLSFDNNDRFWIAYRYGRLNVVVYQNHLKMSSDLLPKGRLSPASSLSKMVHPKAGFAVLRGTRSATVAKLFCGSQRMPAASFANTPLWRSNYAIHPIAIADVFRYFTGDGSNQVFLSEDLHTPAQFWRIYYSLA